MDPAHVFRQGLGSVAPRQHHTNTLHIPRRPIRDDLSDDHGDGPGRIAHTLTACCRCRQRKTRCDPTLPRCLPCERSGSVCEYLDTTKGRRINRFYVIKLQEKVRALEAELGKYVDDEGEYPRTSEDMIRPGGMVRLGAGDETPRYLGPSSGIAMTRLLMEEAKRFTESNRISDLIPALRARRQLRMQSIQMTSQASGHKKSYPMTSELPAKELPRRDVAERLVQIFNQKSQVFWPILHEKTFQNDFDAVYDKEDPDVYKNFVVRMVIAISLQKLEDQYAGLAHSYYLMAMQDFETVLRPKDLKTLQCLALIGHYSMITPTGVPIYFVLGLAAKICQQEGLVDEKTITAGYNLNALTIDMRRRLVWTIASMEYGLAHSLGRPNSFATADEQLDVKFFANVDDEYITENGIAENAPISDAKLVAIHLAKMRLLQAEIRRTLYERKKLEPKNDNSSWFVHMESKLKDWIEASPENPPWSKSWFAGRHHQMRISMYRPSPQISKPSPRAAQICFESSKFIIDLSRKQVQSNSVDITWIFLLVLNMSLNTLLWTTSYGEVRQIHGREEVEDLVEGSVFVLDRCAERWPGTEASSQLYSIFSKACLQSYEANGHRANAILTTPPAISEASQSPDQFSNAGSTPQAHPYLNPPNFGYVFDASPEAMNTYTTDPSFPPPNLTFRSNSIFQNPGTMDTHGRRFSYFPPDFTQLDDVAAPEDPTPPSTTPDQRLTSPPNHMSIAQLPTPPESLGGMSAALSPPNMMSAHSQASTPASMPPNISPPTKLHHVQPQVSQRIPPYQMPPSSHPAPPQRPLPQQPPSASANWFNPPAPFISAYSFGAMGTPLYGDVMNSPNVFNDLSVAGLGLQNVGPGPGGPAFAQSAGRQGSLTHTQQLELMNVLETEGISDIDAFLNGGSMPAGARWY